LRGKLPPPSRRGCNQSVNQSARSARACTQAPVSSTRRQARPTPQPAATAAAIRSGGAGPPCACALRLRRGGLPSRTPSSSVREARESEMVLDEYTCLGPDEHSLADAGVGLDQGPPASNDGQGTTPPPHPPHLQTRNIPTTIRWMPSSQPSHSTVDLFRGVNAPPPPDKPFYTPATTSRA
jgi:hypothetical protein